MAEESGRSGENGTSSNMNRPSIEKARDTETSNLNDDGSEDFRKPECAICLQPCIHPVKLPCRHIFCFLCVKGIANQSKRCAMCRQEIPPDYLDKPNLLSTEDLDLNVAFEDGFQWFYEGRNGWWQYDERTSFELESAYKRGDLKFEILVAGFLYIVDFQHMVQMRRNDPSRRRRIKRDFATISKKGVAGIRVEPTEVPVVEEVLEENSWTLPGNADVPVCDDAAADGNGYLSVTRVKVPSTTPATPSNTPQTPLSGTDVSVPSSPGQTTILESVEQSLVDALHTLNLIDGDRQSLHLDSRRVGASRQVRVHPWDPSYTEEEL